MNDNNNTNAAAIPVGFRFHPTDEELVGYYLHGKVERAQQDQLIQELDLYKIEPWDLHELCRIGDDTAENQSDWYFFSHKDKKYPTGNRSNRATAAGFWKATGRDKPIHTSQRCHVIGMRKTLVFYRGRAPHGQKTDWIMHEFRLDSEDPHYESAGWVVCRVFRKTKNWKTRSQDDLSCSFEEDQSQVRVPNQLLSEPTHFASAHHANGSAISGNYGEFYNPNIPHHHFNFACKQEISVDDYGGHHDHPCSSSFPATDTGSHLHELHRFEGTVTGHPPSPSNYSSSALIRSYLQQACRPRSLDHYEFLSGGAPAFHGESTSLNGFDDARSSNNNTVNITTQDGPSHYRSLPPNEDWMRRDQTLADVACQIHLKRQTTTKTSSDRSFVSHENLVHHWNV